jgi:hypothetical protein
MLFEWIINEVSEFGENSGGLFGLAFWRSFGFDGNFPSKIVGIIFIRNLVNINSSNSIYQYDDGIHHWPHPSVT